MMGERLCRATQRTEASLQPGLHPRPGLHGQVHWGARSGGKGPQTMDYPVLTLSFARRYKQLHIPAAGTCIRFSVELQPHLHAQDGVADCCSFID